MALGQGSLWGRRQAGPSSRRSGGPARAFHLTPRGGIALIDEVADLRERSFAHLHTQQAGTFGCIQLALEVFDGGEPQLGLLPQHTNQAGAIRSVGEVAWDSTCGLNGQDDGLG